MTRLGWLAAGVFVALVLGANAHLAYVAFASQPNCVAHTKLGEVSTPDTAAKSSC